MSFEQEKYTVVKNVLNSQIIEFLKIQTKMLEHVLITNNNGHLSDFLFNDNQIKECFSFYSPLFSESLLVLLQPIIEQITGKKLLPTYSYVRIYYKNAILEKHTDRNSCEYSASICIKNDKEPWDFWIKNIHDDNTCISLEEGDLIIYKGKELEHWREKYNNNEHIQFFLHYVDSNGINSEWKYDKRKMLGQQNYNK
jgi:hypothetical protein